MVSKNDDLRSYLGVPLANAAGRAATGFTSFQQSFSLCSKAVPSPSHPSRISLCLAFLFFNFFSYYALQAQFPPQAGQPGSTAIHKDSSIFVGWAKTCQVQRGYLDIKNPSQGFASAGSEQNAIGPADNSIVSLGDSGIAILTFDYPIQNGIGPDFAIFENGFNSGNGSFLELAHVEVSSDGIHFVRFPSISLTDTNTQIGGFGLLDATKIHNLAGKYILNYGTPFDLEDLKDSSNLDINHITHIKIIDVIGCIEPNYRSYDSQGNPINDPYPTPFASSGFDLDAVGVIHWNTQVNRYQSNDSHVQIYPTYFHSQQNKILHIKTNIKPLKMEIYNANGQLIDTIFHYENVNPFEWRINKICESGMYFVKLIFENEIFTQKIIVYP